MIDGNILLCYSPLPGDTIERAAACAVELRRLNGNHTVILEFNGTAIKVDRDKDVPEIVKEYWRERGQDSGRR